jgi:competence protein ComGC
MPIVELLIICLLIMMIIADMEKQRNEDEKTTITWYDAPHYEE